MRFDLRAEELRAQISRSFETQIANVTISEDTVKTESKEPRRH